MSALKKRQRIILQALKDLGGKAPQRQIAAKAGFDVNGVSQSLGALQMRGFVECAGRTEDRDWLWQLRQPCPTTP